MEKKNKFGKIKTILLIAAAALIVADGIFLMIRYFSDTEKKLKASEIVNPSLIEKTEFFADENFFDDFPDNTSYAVDYADEKNMDGMILDVYKTKDGKWVCAGTDDLKELTGAEGKIKDNTYFTIIKNNLKFKGNDGERPVVQLLDEVVGKCIDSDLVPLINVHNKEETDSLLKILDKYLLSAKKLCFISDDFDFLQKLSQFNPDYTFCYTVKKLSREEIDRAQMFKKGCILFDAGEEKKDDTLIYDLINKKISFGVYNLNSEKELKLYSAYKPSVIITEKLVP